MEIQISKYVLQGSAVKLGYLGSFIPQLKAQSQESADLVDANTIKRYGCRFYPSVDFKRNIERTKFQMTDLKVKGKISKKILRLNQRKFSLFTFYIFNLL